MGREGTLPTRCQHTWRRASARPTRARAGLKACATLASCVTGLAICLPAPAVAQQPFVVDDAEVTPLRQWHIQISGHVDWLRPAARPVLWQGTLESDFNYGLLNRVEVGAQLPFIGLVSDRTVAPRVINGIGDVSFGAKLRLTRDPEARHAFAGSVSIELPTGNRSRNLGSGLVDYGANVVSQHRLATSLTLRFNGGVVLAGNTQTGAIGIRHRGTILTGGGSLVAAVSQRLQVGAELTTARSQKATIGGSFTAWQAGGNLVLRPGLTLDAGVLGGWGDASSRWGLQVGTSINLP